MRPARSIPSKYNAGRGRNVVLEEEWRDSSIISGYQVSNLGNIRREGHNNRIPQDNGNGYKYIRVNRGGEHKNYYVHRLVATEFCPNPLGYKEINHLDGRRDRNCASNLQWCSHSQNLEHSFRILGRKNSKKQRDAARETIMKVNKMPELREKATKNRMKKYWSLPKETRQERQMAMVNKNRKPVLQKTLSGETVAIYSSVVDAEKATGIWASNIGLCCRGGISQAGKFHWEFVDKSDIIKRKEARCQ